MVRCPFVAAKAEEAEPAPEPEASGTMDEGTIDINGYKISGIRTYSIILIIVLTYCALAFISMDPTGIRDLALMACGFLFGIKTIARK